MCYTGPNVDANASGDALVRSLGITLGRNIFISNIFRQFYFRKKNVYVKWFGRWIFF